jgi:hypothetical protein
LPAEVPEPAEPASVPPPVETIRLSSLEQFGAAQATLTNEGNVYRVNVTAVDGTTWHAKLSQIFDDLQEGATYTIRFRARAKAPRSITLYAHIDEPDFQGIGLSETTIPLTTDWRTYQCQFQAKGLAAWNMIEFQVGQQIGTVWIKDFTVTKVAKEAQVFVPGASK